MSELFMEDVEDYDYDYSYDVDDDGFNADISNWDTSSVTDMRQMFSVRSPPCPAPNLQSRPALHAACTAVARRLPPPNPYTSPRAACPPFNSRQGASVFNQPLSFDTSSVTDMSGMFYVRSSPRALPPICSRALSCTLCLHRGRPPPPARRPAYLAPHLLSTLRSTRRRSTSR